MAKVEVEDQHERLALVERDVRNLNEQLGSLTDTVKEVADIQRSTQSEIGRIGQGVEAMQKAFQADRSAFKDEMRELAREQRDAGRINYPLLGLIVSIIGVTGYGMCYALTRPAELVNEWQTEQIKKLDDSRERGIERELQSAREMGRLSAVKEFGGKGYP